MCSLGKYHQKWCPLSMAMFTQCTKNPLFQDFQETRPECPEYVPNAGNTASILNSKMFQWRFCGENLVAKYLERSWKITQTHRIHVWYSYLHLVVYINNQISNVGKYIIHGSYGKYDLLNNVFNLYVRNHHRQPFGSTVIISHIFCWGEGPGWHLSKNSKFQHIGIFGDYNP